MQSDIIAEDVLIDTSPDYLNLSVPLRIGLASKGIFTVRDVVVLLSGTTLLSIRGID